jgi:hypothetical protein
MATPPTTVNILHGPIPTSPLVVDAPDGNVRTEWRRFFDMLWNRTGGPTGSVGVAGVASFNGRTGPVTLTGTDVAAAGASVSAVEWG